MKKGLLNGDFPRRNGNVIYSVNRPYVFRRNGRVHLNRRWGASVLSITGSRGVRVSGSNDGYTMFRGSVKSTGYPLHSPVSPSLTLSRASPCAIRFQTHYTSDGVHRSCMR